MVIAAERHDGEGFRSSPVHGEHCCGHRHHRAEREAFPVVLRTHADELSGGSNPVSEPRQISTIRHWRIL